MRRLLVIVMVAILAVYLTAAVAAALPNGSQVPPIEITATGRLTK